MIQSFTSISAHGRSELYGLTQIQTNKIVSIGLNSYVNIWDLRNFQLLNSKKFKNSYLTSIYSNGQQLIMGNGQGQLIFLDKSTLQIEHVVKIHNDCINDIKMFDGKIVTASNDGTIAIIDQKKNSQFSKIQIGVPVRQIQKFRNSYFTAGTHSFQVDQELNVTKSAQANKLLTNTGQIYGTNDQKGLFCLSRKYHTYVPCENMIKFNKGIIGVSWSTISYFQTFQQDERIAYNSTRIPQISEGDSILSMLSIGNRIIAGSQCGNIYTFNINDEYHWYN